MSKLSKLIFAICALALFSFGALAQDQNTGKMMHDKDKMLKEHFEFSSDVMVGDTLVKKGYYLVKYDTEAGMVKVVDARDTKKVVATAKATVKMSDKDFPHDEILTREMSGHSLLTGLRLGGQKEELTLAEENREK